jgi:hypothetical protein
VVEAEAEADGYYKECPDIGRQASCSTDSMLTIPFRLTEEKEVADQFRPAGTKQDGQSKSSPTATST